MKLKFLFVIFLFLGLEGCSYQEPQLVVIDSNVAAFVYQGEKRLGETPYIGKVARGDIGSLTLKKQGYDTVKVPVEKVYSRKAGPLTSEYTQEGLSSEDENMEAPMVLTMFVSLPLSTVTDGTMFLNGYWIEYMPNSFYVEMVPSNRQKAAVDVFRNYQIKNFALKMYPSLVKGDRETLTALAGLSGQTEDELSLLLSRKTDPVSFAEAVARF
ncbi:MAG: hypothetical protein J5787_04365 [Alphaproteobacteria bacterium]|nr:hypothetical protein [Alphaproteobacteria bacterium]